MSKIVIKQLISNNGCPEENSLVKANDKYYVVSLWENGHTNYSIKVRESDKNGNRTSEKVIYSTTCFYGHFYEVCENLEKYLKK